MKRRVLAAGIAALTIAASLIIATTSAATADPLTTNGVRGGPTPNSQLMPETLRVDETKFKVVETLRGVGKQVYDCKNGAYAFREPMAGLFATRGLPLPAGIHGFVAPATPFWADFDGSKVVGATKVSVPAPNPAADINWLLVGATSNAGTGGVLSNVAFIQRTDTHGGVALTTCGAPTISVDYTTFYVFWALR